MATFYDALSGEKRKLNINKREERITPYASWCNGSFIGHSWDMPDDEFCKCNKCGATVLFVRALKNVHKEKNGRSIRP